ncbi:MAG: hypothetical protein L3J11_05315 [Draconibacterium sp.]|nr:hypothetical protein [Draconibacterium sp.]
MKRNCYLLFSTIVLILFIFSCQTEKPKSADQILNAQLFECQDIETRWNSFENPTSGKGVGSQENIGAKGHLTII